MLLTRINCSLQGAKGQRQCGCFFILGKITTPPSQDASLLVVCCLMVYIPLECCCYRPAFFRSGQHAAAAALCWCGECGSGKRGRIIDDCGDRVLAWFMLIMYILMSSVANGMVKIIPFIDGNHISFKLRVFFYCYFQLKFFFRCSSGVI